MANAGEWQRLCALLDEDEAVWLAVRTALDGGGDAWEALLDGLDEAGALAYLQAEDTGMELSDALAQLPRVFRSQPDLDAVTDTDELATATVVADAVLQASDLRVVRLVEEDDAWPVAVVPASAAPEIVRLAETVGHRAIAGG